MRNAFYLLLMIFFAAPLCAQQTQVFHVKAGETVADKVSLADMYRYPSFTKGMVYLKNGDQSSALLNYNALAGEMQFLNGLDTLSLAKEDMIRLLTIGSDTFYFNNGYMELIESNKNVKLARKVTIKLASAQRKGAYGQSLASGADTYRGISNGNHITNLVIQEDMTLVKEPEYFFGNENNKFLPANKKNIIKLFSKQENKLSRFIDENKINFQKEEDLKMLISFLKDA